MDDIRCGCPHGKGEFPTKRFKEVFDGVEDPEEKRCIMDIIEGLVEGELSLPERRYLIDMIVMQMVTMNAMESIKIDAAMEHMPAVGRGDN
jgi:hypothetical protein